MTLMIRVAANGVARPSARRSPPVNSANPANRALRRPGTKPSCSRNPPVPFRPWPPNQPNSFCAPCAAIVSPTTRRRIKRPRAIPFLVLSVEVRPSNRKRPDYVPGFLVPKHRAVPLILSVPAPHRLQELGRIVSHAVLEHDLDVLDIRDATSWIALHHHQVRVLANGDRADLILAAEKGRAVQGRDVNGLDRREPGLDQQLDLPLIPEAGDVTGETDRIGAREQGLARRREGARQAPLPPPASRH